MGHQQGVLHQGGRGTRSMSTGGHSRSSLRARGRPHWLEWQAGRGGVADLWMECTQKCKETTAQRQNGSASPLQCRHGIQGRPLLARLRPPLLARNASSWCLTLLASPAGRVPQMEVDATELQAGQERAPAVNSCQTRHDNGSGLSAGGYLSLGQRAKAFVTPLWP